MSCNVVQTLKPDFYVNQKPGYGRLEVFLCLWWFMADYECLRRSSVVRHSPVPPEVKMKLDDLWQCVFIPSNANNEHATARSSDSTHVICVRVHLETRVSALTEAFIPLTSFITESRFARCHITHDSPRVITHDDYTVDLVPQGGQSIPTNAPYRIAP